MNLWHKLSRFEKVNVIGALMCLLVGLSLLIATILR